MAEETPGAVSPLNGGVVNPNLLSSNFSIPTFNPTGGGTGTEAVAPKLASMSTAQEIKNLIHNAPSYATDQHQYGKVFSYGADYTHQNFERYYEHPEFDKLGFSAWRDNESLYNANSSWFDDFRRAAGQWGSLAGTGFVSGVSSWGDLLSGQPLKEDLSSAAAFDRAMSIGQSTRGGVGGFTSNLFLNSAYTFGVMGEMIAEEALLLGATALTGGAASEVTVPLMGTRGLSAISRLSKLTEGVKGTWRIMTEMNSLSRARKFWEASKYVGKGTMEFLNPLSNTVDYFKASSSLNGLAKGHSLFGSFYRDVRMINFSLAEAKLEGGSAYLEMERSLTDDFYSKNKRMPNATEMEKIHEAAKGASSITTLINVPAIYYTNKITFDNLFKGFRPIEAMTTDFMTKAGTRVAFDKAATTAGKEAFKIVEPGLKAGLKSFLKPKTYAKAGLNYFKGNLSEGLQETTQEIISGAARDYYTNLYNDPGRRGMDYVTSSILQSTQSQFSSQGLNTFMSGFLMGSMVHPVGEGFKAAKIGYYKFFKPEQYQQYQEQKTKYTEDLVNRLNEMYRDPLKYFAPDLMNVAAQRSTAAAMENAQMQGDEKSWRDLRDSSVYEHIWTALESGSYDKFVERLNSLKDMNVETFNEAFNVTNGDTALANIDNVVGRANAIRDSYNIWQEKAPNPFDPSKYKKDTPEYENEAISYSAWQLAKKHAIFMNYSFKRTLDRMNSILQDLNRSNPLQKAPANDISLLFNPSSLASEIKILDQEIKSAAISTDPTINRSLADKKDKLEALLEFAGRLYAYQDSLRIARSADQIVGGEAAPSEVQDALQAILTNRDETSNSLKESYLKYLRSIARANSDHVIEDAVNRSFTQLKDFYDLEADAANLSESVNLLSDPQGFTEHFSRNLAILRDLYSSREDAIRQGMEIIQEKRDTNSLLNRLYEKGIVMLPQDIEAFLKDGTLPQYFYDTVNKVAIGQADLRYQELANILLEHESAVKSEVKPQDSSTNISEPEKRSTILKAISDGAEVNVTLSDGSIYDVNTTLRAYDKTAGTINAYKNGKQIEIPIDSIIKVVAQNDNKVLYQVQPVERADLSPKEPAQVSVNTPWENLPQDLRDQLQPLWDKYQEENMKGSPDYEIERVRQNWLTTPVAIDLIYKYNIALKSKESSQRVLKEAPTLRTVRPSKPLDELSISTLSTILRTLRERQQVAASSGDMDVFKDQRTLDIQDVEDYIKYRRSLTPQTKADKVREMIERIEKNQSLVQGRSEDNTRYIIGDELYKRVTSQIEPVAAELTGTPPFMYMGLPEAMKLFGQVISVDGNLTDFMNFFRAKKFAQFNERKYQALEDSLRQNFTMENLANTINELAYDASRIVGNTIDGLVRNFFQEKELIRPDNMTQEAFDALIERLTEIRDNMIDKNLTILTNNIVVFDPVTKVAGEIDILAIDNEGELYIYDIKTSRKANWEVYEDIGSPKSNKIKHQLQVSAYGNLLYNSYGVLPKGYGIIPIEVTYDENGNIETLKGRKTIKLEYMPEVEAAIPRNAPEQPVATQEDPEDESIGGETPTQQIQNIESVSTSVTVDPKIPTKINDLVGQVVVWKGRTGVLDFNTDGTYVVDTGKTIFDITRNPNDTPESLGIVIPKKEENILNKTVIGANSYRAMFLNDSQTEAEINGIKYKVNRNNVGNIVSLTYTTNQREIDETRAKIADIQRELDQLKANAPEGDRTSYFRDLYSKQGQITDLNQTLQKLTRTQKSRTTSNQDLVFSLNSLPHVVTRGKKTFQEENDDIKIIKGFSLSPADIDLADQILSENYPSALDTFIDKGAKELSSFDLFKIQLWAEECISSLEAADNGRNSPQLKSTIDQLYDLLNDLENVRLTKDGKIKDKVKKPKAVSKRKSGTITKISTTGSAGPGSQLIGGLTREELAEEVEAEAISDGAKAEMRWQLAEEYPEIKVEGYQLNISDVQRLVDKTTSGKELNKVRKKLLIDFSQGKISATAGEIKAVLDNKRADLDTNLSTDNLSKGDVVILKDSTLPNVTDRLYSVTSVTGKSVRVRKLNTRDKVISIPASEITQRIEAKWSEDMRQPETPQPTEQEKQLITQSTTLAEQFSNDDTRLQKAEEDADKSTKEDLKNNLLNNLDC